MKPIAYLDFDLQIERAGDGYRAQVLDSPAGNATHTFSLPFAPLELENYLLRLGAMRQGMRGGSSPEAETAKNFGGRLFETVFDGEVQGCLHSSLNMASQQGKGLRIRLRLTEAPDLLDLPWEYLYNRTRNLFYALSVETPLVRYLEMPERIMPLAITPPLRVLVMIASPKGYPPLNVEREWQKLHTAVRDLEDRGLMVLERIEQATLPALRRRLRTTDYHLFHFIGHGDFDPQTQDGALIFEDEDGLGFRASGQSLSVLMRDYRHTLRLVILNACEGARTAGSDPFAGTAQRLIQQGIPAVIAMQFEVTDEPAIAFAQEFYAALTDSFPVDAALTEARKAISIEALSSRGGSVARVLVSLSTRRGWWNAPIRFLPSGWFTPVLPPNARSTMASRVVGICTSATQHRRRGCYYPLYHPSNSVTIKLAYLSLDTMSGFHYYWSLTTQLLSSYHHRHTRFRHHPHFRSVASECIYA